MPPFSYRREINGRDEVLPTCVFATPDGAATLSLYSLATNIDLVPERIGCHGTKRGDRAIVCSNIVGQDETYAVFERETRDRHWRPVTDALRGVQLDHWEKHRVPAGTSMSPRFDGWLNSICGDAQPAVSAR